MDGEDWTNLDEKHLETWQQRVELVEALLDERIHETGPIQQSSAQ